MEKGRGSCGELRKALSLVLSVLMVSSGEEEEVTGCERRGGRREPVEGGGVRRFVAALLPLLAMERKERGGSAAKMEVLSEEKGEGFWRVVYSWEREEPVV
ncbi:hypothetical protein HAX54_018908, partial [Datura stramonium]|nr:hypothetical protein [Datura stramonium]